MSKNKKNTQEQEQPKTRYDRKMEARRKQAAKDKRNSIIARSIAILILVAIVGSAGYLIANHFIQRHKALNDAYLSIGNHQITQVEYEYNFNSTVNDYISMYSYYLSYMGLDTSTPFDEQEYSEDMTWQDYFEQMTIEQLKQEYALIDDAKATGFEYDPSEEYAEYLTNIQTQLDENKMSMQEYVKSAYGTYATEKNVKPFVENSLTASAYYQHLVEINAPDDDEITAYYEEHQTEYDKVSYNSFSFDEVSYPEEAQSNAEDMLSRLQAGEDFDTLCYEYALEDAKENYVSEDTEYSLTSSVTSSSMNSLFVDWLYDSSRKEGDVTLLSDPDSGIYYVLKFVSKTYDDTCRDTISSTLSSDAAGTYLDGLIENYDAKDIKGEIGYLKLSAATEDGSESLLNTDIIE